MLLTLLSPHEAAVGADQPPGLSATTRPVLSPRFAVAHNTLPPDAVPEALPVGGADARKYRRPAYYAAAASWALSSLVLLSAPVAAELPPGQGSAGLAPSRPALFAAHSSAAPGDDGVAPPDLNPPVGAGTLDARPPVRLKRPELRAFAFYYIEEEELRPPGRAEYRTAPPVPRRAVTSPHDGPTPLLAVPPEILPIGGSDATHPAAPAAVPTRPTGGHAAYLLLLGDIAPEPLPVGQSAQSRSPQARQPVDPAVRGTAQLEPPPPAEPLPPGTPASTSTPPTLGPYYVAHGSAAPGDDGIAPPAEIPIGAGTVAARPPVPRPIVRPASFYYVVENELLPPSASATTPAARPTRMAARQPQPRATRLLDVPPPALPPGSSVFESGPKRRVARRPVVNGTDNGLVLFPEPVAEPLPPPQPESPYDAPTPGSGASIYEPAAPSRPNATSPFDDPTGGSGGSLW
jgi:hypothetical protein